MDKKGIVKILMDRDEVPEELAWGLVNEVQGYIDDALENDRPYKVEDILASCLGLEMDYIWAFV